MTAKLFLAIGAGKIAVGGGGEALGMEPVGDFPPNEKGQGEAQKTVGIKAWDEHQRGEHHGKVPVVDAAGGTTPVFHEPGLEGDLCGKGRIQA